MSFAENLLKSLNEAQKEGVLNTEGPCMVVAGAGSGKTRTLTNRVAYLVGEKKIDPFAILVLTFTNKAAKEMKERIVQQVGEVAQSMWIGTFHSVFARVLRSEAEKIGHTARFSIYDTEDSKKLIADIVHNANLSKENYKAGKVLYRISDAKNKFIPWQEYTAHRSRALYDRRNGIPRLHEVYEQYAKRCFEANAMDFDDLLFNTQKLFKESPETLHRYQHRFRYILIDEFQDTNLCQYMIVKTLAAAQRNLCVVGDDAQSIYSFRGAEVGNMLSFQKDYPDARLIRLERNYRSTENIVHASNELIAKNHLRIEKKIWTENPSGTRIKVTRAENNQEESKWIADQIFEQKAHYHYRNSDFAILYRNNSLSRSVEEALRRARIPYRIYSGLSFYQRKEVKDVLAYLRLLVNPDDEQALLRIINYPRRGIGDATIEQLMARARAENISLWAVLQEVRKHPIRRTEQAIGEFVVLIKRLMKGAKEKNAEEITLDVVRESGIMKLLSEESWDFQEKEQWKRGETPALEHVETLLQNMADFVKDEEEEDPSLSTFLQKVSLLTTEDEKKEEETVSLMTMHGCKGLEFKVVFIVSAVEGILPDHRSETSHELEEERRVFYVALTRAMEKVFISYPRIITRYRRSETCAASRFLEEVEGPWADFGKRKEAAPPADVSLRMNTARRLRPLSSLKESPAEDAANGLTVGTKVWHAKFGMGVVQRLERYQSTPKAIVSFEKVGEKTMLLAFAKLKILP